MSAIRVNLGQILPESQPVKFDDNIRVGNRNDGGYIVPRRVLPKITHLVSFGLGQDCTFELGLKALNNAITIDVYDHTVSPPSGRILLRNFFFSIVYRDLGRLTSYRKFVTEYKILFSQSRHFMNRVNSHRSRTYDVPISEILQLHTSKKIAMKIDIEGDEYKILFDIIEHSSNIQLLVIEFHDIQTHLEMFREILALLQETFVISHLHANNFGDMNVFAFPDVLELTFVRSEFSSQKIRVSSLPVENLDFPNNPGRDDFAINWG